MAGDERSAPSPHRWNDRRDQSDVILVSSTNALASKRIVDHE